MKNERSNDGPLDVILSMGRLSTEGNIYRLELEIRGGCDVGKVVQVEQAHVFPAGSGRFMIIERHADGLVNRAPVLARYHQEGFDPENVLKSLGELRRAQGTRRFGLGHVG